MTIFEYLIKEQNRLLKFLEDLINTYSDDTSEYVFDHVKNVCDGIIAHLKKQELLLVNNIPKTTLLKEMLEESNQSDTKVSDEVGQLLMVHIDEPEYTECLTKLLNVLKQHFEFSKRLYKTIEENVSKEDIAKINELLENEMFKITDFNELELKTPIWPVSSRP